MTREQRKRKRGAPTEPLAMGFFYVERDSDSSSIFIFQDDVEKNRRSKVDDRVEFDTIPSRRLPDKLQAINVRYLGHVIARQVSERQVSGEVRP